MADSRPLSLQFLNPTGVGVWGGVEAWMRAAALGMRARGHAVHVAGRPGGRFLTGMGSEGVEGVEIDGRGDFSLRDISRLGRAQRRHRVDVVITKLNRGIRLAGCSARFARGRRAVLAHMGLMEAKRGLGSRLAYRAFLTGVNVPCRSIATQLIEERGFDSGRVHVIPYGIDVTRFEADPARRERVRRELGIGDAPAVALVARLDDQKGHGDLLDALTRLDGVHALLAGTGAREADLRRRVADLGLGARVHFMGHLTDVRGPLDAADALVLPSYDEGLPNIVLESMAMGRPVVATRVGGLAEAVADGETGFLVEPRRPGELAAAIQRLLARPDRGRALGAAGRVRAHEDYRDTVMVERVERMLLEVVRQRGRVVGSS